MHQRCLNKASQSFFDEILSVKDPKPASSKAPSVVSEKDALLLRSIPSFLGMCGDIKAPCLSEVAQNYIDGRNPMGTALSIYDKRTCSEFHDLLCALLRGFRDSLHSLNEGSTKSISLEVLQKRVDAVQLYGMALQVMAYSNIIEQHVSSIVKSLLIKPHDSDSDSDSDAFEDGEDEWGEQEEEDGEQDDAKKPIDDEDTDVALVRAMDDRPAALLEWLRLIISHFHSVKLVSMDGAPLRSLTVVAVPHQGQSMIPWKDLMRSLFGDKARAYIELIEELQKPKEGADKKKTNLNTSSHFKKFFGDKGRLSTGVFCGTVHCELCLACTDVFSEVWAASYTCMHYLIFRNVSGHQVYWALSGSIQTMLPSVLILTGHS
jgi:hypothetical protein